MKNISFWLLALSSWLLMSCVDIEERDDTATGNFEALWTILDEHYCFFDYKQKEYGLDWNEVHEKYKVRVNDNMSSTQLFEVLCDMLGERQYEQYATLRGTVRHAGRATRRTRQPVEFDGLRPLLEVAGELSLQL